jgi:hypothetical protein
LRVARGHNLWIPVSKTLNHNLRVAWVRMKGMAAKRLKLKTLLEELGTDLEINNSVRCFSTLSDKYISEATGASEGDGVNSEDEWNSGSEEEGSTVESDEWI